MKKTALFAALLCALSIYTQTGRTEVTHTELVAGGGKTATVLSPSDLSDELAQKIRTALDAAWNIPGLDGTEANVLVESPDEFRFVIYPSVLSYRGTDFIPYLPSGMTFYYTSALFYDITLKVNEYAPKVTGLFVSPADLLKNMYAATIMPDMYMFDNYLLNRVARLETALMAQTKKTLFKKAQPVAQEIILAIRGYYNENADITKNEVADRLKNDGFKASKSDIDAVFLVILGKTE